MEPNLDCKVARYPNSAIQNTHLHNFNNWPGSTIDIVLSSYKFITFPGYGDCYRAYGTRINGNSYVWYLRDVDNRMIEFDIGFINNLTSRQRRFIKEARAQLDEFLKSKYDCKGCIHRNNYLLTNKCNETYTEAKDVL